MTNSILAYLVQLGHRSLKDFSGQMSPEKSLCWSIKLYIGVEIVGDVTHPSEVSQYAAEGGILARGVSFDTTK